MHTALLSLPTRHLLRLVITVGVLGIFGLLLPASAHAASPANAAWWRSFDDPLLTQLIDEALSHNTDIALAQGRITQMQAARRLSASALAPTLNIQGSANRSVQSQQAVTTDRLGLDGAWNPDLSGAQAAALRGADLDVASAQISAIATQQTVAAAVALAYIPLRGFWRQLNLSLDNLDAQQQTQQLTAWRAQAGLGSTLEAEQARANTEQTRANLPGIEANIRTHEHRLSVLLGMAPDALHERLGRSDQMPLVPQPLPDHVAANILRRRADLQAAELSIQAEAARLDSQQAARWPSFTLSGSLALQAATLSGLGASGAWLAALGAAVTWPLLDGGNREARISAQEAVFEQARLSYQNATRVAMEDVANALVGVESTQRQIEALQHATQAAHNALTLAQHRYRAGLVDFTTLLDAQRTALSLDISLASAQTQHSLSLVQLGQALGGDWNTP
jgi:NodT family efflux transporter outer membrane factor (OMF) lipoprotein